MKIIKIIIVLGIIFAATGCDKEDLDVKRSYYMGFSPFPYAVSQEAVDFTYAKLATDADMVNHHFDNGVPWVEAFANEPFHPNIMNDWTFRKNATPAGLKVYVSVTPLNFERNGMANYRSETENSPLPTPWDTCHFNDEKVKSAYLNYCKRIIDFFHPHFFNMAIEANLLYAIHPPLWSDFLEFHEYIYRELKQRYPALTIFSSVAGSHMLEGFFDGKDHVQQRLAVLQVLSHSDLYALSFYPYLTNYLGNPYPKDTFEKLFSISDKPLAIAETGYAAQSFTIAMEGSEVMIATDQTKQNKYIEDLLTACEKHKALFVINFVVRDYDSLWQAMGAKNDLSIAWRDTGLYDENGNIRSALATWRNYLARHYNP